MALTGQVLDIYVDYIICLRKGKQGAIEAYLYAVACHHEELIALCQEGNALEEHLHRAVKDMVVNFLQILGERILEVYSYIPTTADTQQLALNSGVNFYDYVEDLVAHEDYKVFIQSLHPYYAKMATRGAKF